MIHSPFAQAEDQSSTATRTLHDTIQAYSAKAIPTHSTPEKNVQHRSLLRPAASVSGHTPDAETTAVVSCSWEIDVSATRLVRRVLASKGEQLSRSDAHCKRGVSEWDGTFDTKVARF